MAVNDKLEYAVVRLGPPLQEEAATPAAAAPAAAEAAAEASVSGSGPEAGSAPATPAGPKFGKGNRNPGAVLRALSEAGVEGGKGGRLLVVGLDLVEKLEQKFKARLEVVCTVPGSALEGCK